MIETISIFHKQPRLTLVGAGPGDPELVTVKAVNTLMKADVVLYDALVSEEILALIPTGIPAFSVGKRAGEHACRQEEINELIVEFAYRYGHVIRLKGGDPFVFGRGSEEIEYAESHGVQTAVVPGISSALAVPSSLNIPVTARGVSESLWIVTGTTKSGALSTDVALAAQSSATVVILMGLNKLNEIMAHFIAHGKANVPVAIVQNGTLPHQQSVIGTVASVTEQAAVQKIGSPAVIIIGEVVRYARALNQVLVAVG